MEDPIRAVVIPPFGMAYSTLLPGTVGSLQEVTDGTLAFASQVEGEVGIWCCQEARALMLPFCRVLDDVDGRGPGPVYGQAVACGFSRLEDGPGFRGLTFDEAVSVLSRDRIRLPQYLSRKQGDPRTHVNVAIDGAGEGFFDIVTNGSVAMIELNCAAGLFRGDGRAHPYPLVGSPEDALCGKWRVHIVYPGDALADDGRAVERRRFEGSPSSEGLPIVEFFDMSQDALAFPRGQFVSSFFMADLLRDESSFLEGDRFALDGGVPAWTIEGADLAFARQFATQAGDLFRGRRLSTTASRDMARDPAAIAARARRAAEVCEGGSNEHDGVRASDAVPVRHAREGARPCAGTISHRPRPIGDSTIRS